MKSQPLIVLVGFLDTMYQEHELIAQYILNSGCDLRIIDVSIKDRSPPEHSSLSIHHPLKTVCEAASTSLAHIRSIPQLDALTILAEGVSRVIQNAYAQTLCSIISVGGSSSTAFICSVMRRLKIGIPKLCVSTMASGDVREYIEEGDITLMPSIVNISDTLNDISRRILLNASAAIADMAHQYAPSLGSSALTTSPRKRVGITMFGLTMPGANAVISTLANFESVYDPVVFHASGLGGESMERLIDEGWFDVIIDFTTTELADELDGALTAGPSRLTAASRHTPSISRIVSLGAIDMVNFNSPSTIPECYTNTHSNFKRVFQEHTPEVTLVRTSREECVQLGEIIARKLTDSSVSDEARSKTVVVVPLRGWSGLDVEGGKFWDLGKDEALVDALERGLEGSRVRLERVDAHVNDGAFAERVVEVLQKVAGE